MVAAPRYGTATFQGLKTGKIYSVDIYISDVVAAPVTWDSGSGAGSTTLTFWKAPEPVILTDLSIASGLTDTTTIFPTADGGQIPGVRFRHANFLNSLAFRPRLNLGFKEGTNVGMTQA